MFTQYTFRKIKEILLLTLLFLPIGPLEIYLLDPTHRTKAMYITSLLAVLFISTSILTIEKFFFSRKLFRRMTFILFSIIRTILYIIVIIFFINLARYITGIKTITFLISIKSGLILDKNAIIGLVTALVLSQLVNYINALNRLIGDNMLIRLFVNKYHRPKEEFRMFMFLDIKSSTTIAEKIGHMKFHAFINDFFYLITNPVLETKGHIYKYVGDEVIVVWNLKEGLSNNNCLECHFKIKNLIESKYKEYFMKKYGLIPEFKSGVHCGNVIIGEMGDIRKEISYLGDAVNTTARIQGECNKYNAELLISGVIHDLIIDTEKKYKITSKDTLLLRGKTKKIELYSVSK